MPLHPCASVPPTAMSQGSGAQLRNTMPPWRGASIINCHDYIFPGEGHNVAPTWVLIELRTPGREPRDHETHHHVTVLELVPDGLHVVWAGLLEESLEVVGRRPHLTLVAVCGSRDAPHVGAAHLPIVAVIVVGCGRSPLRTLLAPPIAALGAMPGFWTATSDDASLLLLGVASLLLGGR
jgi:hypothetical protein